MCWITSDYIVNGPNKYICLILKNDELKIQITVRHYSVNAPPPTTFVKIWDVQDNVNTYKVQDVHEGLALFITAQIGFSPNDDDKSQEFNKKWKEFHQVMNFENSFISDCGIHGHTLAIYLNRQDFHQQNVLYKYNRAFTHFLANLEQYILNNFNQDKNMKTEMGAILDELVHIVGHDMWDNYYTR
jgi:hypothetical protein